MVHIIISVHTNYMVLSIKRNVPPFSLIHVATHSARTIAPSPTITRAHIMDPDPSSIQVSEKQDGEKHREGFLGARTASSATSRC